MQDHDVIVIGAGLSGLSCAMELVEKDKKVLILEAQAYLGGRTASWDENGMQVESALHKFLGFYSELPKLIEKSGVKVSDNIAWEDEVEIVTPDGGPQAVFGVSPLGRPLETVFKALGNGDFLSVEDKASFLKFITIAIKDYLIDPAGLDGQTVGEYAKKLNITEPVVERVLRAFAEGILFFPMEKFSMLAMMSFLVPYLHKSIRFGVGAFKGGMSEVMIKPIVETLQTKGVEIRSSSPVEKLLIENEAVVGVIISGEQIRASHTVVATSVGPAHHLTQTAFPEDAWVKDFANLPSMPAISMQIELDKPSWPTDRVVFAPGTALAVFSEQSHTTFPNSAGRLSIDLSPGPELQKMTDEQLYELTVKEGKRIGLDIEPHTKEYRVIRHPEDFYEPSINTNKWRPKQKTPRTGLVLAGDYTSQPTPSTMEGAVLSGQLAAKVI